jgi:hypothetical protein
MMNYWEPYGNIRKIKIGESGGKGGKRGDFASFGTMPKGQGHYTCTIEIFSAWVG